MFIQYATGNFSVAIKGLYHCGPNHDSPKNFRFEVELEYYGKCLDEHGFLYDNTSFQKAFDNAGTISESCELFVQDMAGYFIQGHPCVRSARVKVWAIPGSVNVCCTKTRTKVEIILRKLLTRMYK